MRKDLTLDAMERLKREILYTLGMIFFVGSGTEVGIIALELRTLCSEAKPLSLGCYQAAFEANRNSPLYGAVAGVLLFQVLWFFATRKKS